MRTKPISTEMGFFIFTDSSQVFVAVRKPLPVVFIVFPQQIEKRI